jgi:broad specificity phosphatase PhoE
VVPAIVFIRHGETDWNAEGRLQGQRDIPLNEVGRRQAAEAGRKLRAIVDPAALPWRVSPLARTRETAELARDAIGLPPKDYALDDRLKELTFGGWEGRTWAELKAVDRGLVRARQADKWGFVPPDGESYAMLHERIGAWLPSVTEPTIVVSHGGVARALMVLLSGADPVTACVEDIWQGKLLWFHDGRAEWV